MAHPQSRLGCVGWRLGSRVISSATRRCRLPTARSQVYARGVRHVPHWDARAHALRIQHKSSVLRTQFSTAALSETSEQCHCGACRPHAVGCLTVATENPLLQEVFGRFVALGQGITRLAVLDQRHRDSRRYLTPPLHREAPTRDSSHRPPRCQWAGHS